MPVSLELRLGFEQALERELELLGRLFQNQRH
jgi:hypothetical protein